VTSKVVESILVSVAVSEGYERLEIRRLPRRMVVATMMPW
jgi:hypothetical protein